MRWLLTPLLLLSFPEMLLAQEEEYSFDLSEIEKKPYDIGGYVELRPALFGLDMDSSSHKLKFYDHGEGDTLDEYNLTFQVDASYEKGIAGLYLKTNTDLKQSDAEGSEETELYEGYLSLEPSRSFTFQIGKKTLKWGKGYAWNPVAFVDRSKDPDQPDLAREGYVVASADYIKSLDGPLKTISFTPVAIPVFEHVNEDFGEINNVDFAGKLYLLLYDTDIDFIVLTGGSKTTRFGFDFSRNITSNLEIHGEFAVIDDYKKRSVDADGDMFDEEYDATSYLAGLRYLTASETTCILEYYHNGTGFTESEMEDYFSFIDEAYDTYLSSGDDSLLKKGARVTEGNYGKINPMRDYLYLRISQKEPFDILYSTASLTGMFNTGDNSFSLSPELSYTGITNLELRLKATFPVGDADTEYGEKLSDYRVELRARYYF
jgi:hypothetical protein